MASFDFNEVDVAEQMASSALGASVVLFFSSTPLRHLTLHSERTARLLISLPSRVVGQQSCGPFGMKGQMAEKGGGKERDYTCLNRQPTPAPTPAPTRLLHRLRHRLLHRLRLMALRLESEVVWSLICNSS